jgi:hypothetical protein
VLNSFTLNFVLLCVAIRCYALYRAALCQPADTATGQQLLSECDILVLKRQNKGVSSRWLTAKRKRHSTSQHADSDTSSSDTTTAATAAVTARVVLQDADIELLEERSSTVE